MQSGAYKSVHFTLSAPPSEASSRSSSPAPSSPLFQDTVLQDYFDRKTDDGTPGRQPKDVYDTTLSWWRAAIRRNLVKTVHWESKIIAQMQNKIRTPWLDAYFVYTSSLGTHTFFMILLPAFFFFGYGEMGRGLLMVLALGVYCASVIKDLLCSPRPFAPPVTRLTIGSHHLEYGFPSTHSTNSVSIALFFFGHVHRLASTSSTSAEPIISSTLYTFLSTILSIYTFSIVFGRLYTAMHSFTDCIMGVLLGAGIWWGHTDWSGVPFAISASNPLSSLLGLGTSASVTQTNIIYLGKGLGSGKWIEGWVQRGGWEVPLILIPICLLAVNQHPQPVDDCPCFEDAIAFASVVLGALVSRWAVSYFGAGDSLRRVMVMPGSGWVLESAASGSWVQVDRGWHDVLVWWGFAAVKMIVGVLVIFVWRILAKSALHLILPPTFRLLARAFSLPNRRFYTPATEYKSVPSEFHSDASGGFGLHPIPSVIDLPGSVGVGVETGGIGSGVDGVSNVHGYGRDLKMRNGNGNGNGALNVTSTYGQGGEDMMMKSKNLYVVAHDKERNRKDDGVMHYDADVLTKVIVYAGIAVLATEVLPLMFDVIGWGVKSWVEVIV